MPSLDKRLEFCSKYLTASDGTPFDLKGRQWVQDELFTPLDSYKLWPANKEKLCKRCMAKIGTLVQQYDREVDCQAEDPCDGLICEPVILSALCLPRQSGKTFSTAAYVLSTLFLERGKHIAFIASSEEQAKALFESNYAGPIRRRPKLAHYCRIMATSIDCRLTRSRLDFFTSAHSSVTGRTLTHVVIDEARDVAARTAQALFPSIFARGGWECRGCWQTSTNAGVDDPDVPSACPVCSTPLSPWHGRILCISSAGLVEGTEKDWFAEFIQTYAEQPDANTYIHVSHRKINPKVDSKAVEMMSRVFGALESTKTYADIEAGNTFRRKGEDFLSQVEIAAVVDNRLTQSEGGAKPAVGFLDTSISKELTSLVICEDDSDGGEEPWSRLVVARIDVWEPKKMPNQVIDPQMVQDHLDIYMPMFAMVALRVDTRVCPWATSMVRQCRKDRPWGRVVDGVTKWGGKERRASWTLLEQKIKARLIRIPNHPDLRAELRAARRQYDVNNQIDIREASRRTRHLDIAESLAACCYLAHLETITRKGAGMMKAIRKRSQKESGLTPGQELRMSLQRRNPGFGSWQGRF